MVKLTYRKNYMKRPENAGENQNVISENRSGENPQEISEVELLPMLNERKAEEETSNDPRPSSPSDSEESTYYSGPESTEEDDAIGENRSGEIPEVELLPMLNECKAEEETSNDPRPNSPSDSEESYVSCPETTEENVPRPESPSTSDQHHYHLPTEKQKQIFFEILKDLLHHQSLLELGDMRARQCGGDRLELKYMEETCELEILNSDGGRQWRRVMKTKYIYLEWCGNHMEPLSIRNIQKVQNELEFLGVQSDRVQRCFNLAQTAFMKEPSYIQNNMKLDIICDKVIITFSKGKGENVAIALYDDNLRSPRYNIDVKDWWVRIKRSLRSLMRWIRGLADNTSSISSRIDTLLTCITDFFQNLNFFSKPKSQ